jgi:hypothetical protein
MSAQETSTSAVNTAEKQRGRPFEPGQSGNPNGRPKGSRNRVTRAVEALINGQGEALGNKAVEMALNGDASMLRPLLNTLVPTRRDRTVEFELPKIETAADARAASAAVLAACAGGELSPSEANQIMALISTHVRTFEAAAELEAVAAAKKEEQVSGRLSDAELRLLTDDELDSLIRTDREMLRMAQERGALTDALRDAIRKRQFSAKKTEGGSERA